MHDYTVHDQRYLAAGPRWADYGQNGDSEEVLGNGICDWQAVRGGGRGFEESLYVHGIGYLGICLTSSLSSFVSVTVHNGSI